MRTLIYFTSQLPGLTDDLQRRLSSLRSAGHLRGVLLQQKHTCSQEPLTPAQDSANLNRRGYQQQHCRHRWASAIYSVDLEKLLSAPLVRRAHHFPAHLELQMPLRQQLSFAAAARCALRPAARATAPDK